MFSSNQRFIITGDNEENLDRALNCALAIKEFKIEAISYEDDILILHEHISSSDEKNPELVIIPKEEIGNYKYLLLMIKMYLSSQKYKNLLQRTNDEYRNYDGVTKAGWELGYYDELNKGHGWNRVIYVKPYWTYYAK